jgi:imidazolonepropionase-like amidohydrolase
MTHESRSITRVLTGATLIDGTGSAPIRDAAVVIDGDRIAAAGPRHATSWPADAIVMNLGGRTVLPGLIDAHDHLASHGYGLATRWGLDEPASTAHLRTARVLADTLAMGYTTVRDAGGLDAGFRIAIEQGLIPGPRLVRGLQIISPTGGIGDRASPSGHGCCGAFDPLLPESVANGPDAVRDVVRTMVRAGADVIKTATTGGASSRPGHGPKDAAFSREEMLALVAESHALGRRVMCHALRGPGLRTAVLAGVDSIEHGSYLDEEPELMAQMAARGVFLVATLTVYVYHRESASAHVRAGRWRSTSIMWPRSGAPSSLACPSRRAPTREATDIRRTRSSWFTWWTRASRPCRPCGRPPSGRRSAWGSIAILAPWSPGASPT